MYSLKQTQKYIPKNTIRRILKLQAEIFLPREWWETKVFSNPTFSQGILKCLIPESFLQTDTYFIHFHNGSEEGWKHVTHTPN